MSQQKKRSPGRKQLKDGSKRNGSRPDTPWRGEGKKGSDSKTSTRSSSPKGSQDDRSRPKRRPRFGASSSAEPLSPTAAAPSLGEPPRRKAKTVDAAPAASGFNESETESHDDSRFSDPYPAGAMDVDMLGIGSPVFLPSEFDLTADDADGAAESAASTASPWADDPSVEMRIREIEERLDGLMASEPHEDLDQVPLEPERVAPSSADNAVSAAREVLESEYYRKNWGRTSLRKLTQEVDDFGMDPAFEAKLGPALDFLFKRYFRVDVEGIRHVPARGRAVVVANHSGALPFDGVMLREAIRQRHPGRDDLRWLAEDFSFYLPFLGVTLNRLGAVRACPENAERLLAKEHLVGVFPEGAEGIKKLYKNRYRLQRFGRGGFVRLCLKTGSPIIPCAIIGAEETNPILYRFDNLSKLLGLDYLPITPTFPWLGPLGLLPAPTKWKIVFGEPISVDEYGPQAAHDHVLIGRLAERVRSIINDMLETALRRRKSIWL